ncbi:phage terminase large subunit [Clostridia bacterium]|nr:phage terminase large subunit [Clostridia bacterium]
MSDNFTGFTEKQVDVIRALKRNELKKINILEGSVSSGKTYISLVLWAFWVSTMPRGNNYIMLGRTLETLNRNCLILLEELIGVKNFTFSIGKKEARLFGRRVFLEGANDARSEGKIRGMTLQGAYCDEITILPKDFFEMLITRLRVEGALLIGTTNPDSPSHWLMKDYLAPDANGRVDTLSWNFTIDDNTKLPSGYVEHMKRGFSGVFYERFILGRWVIAEGLIYGGFKQSQIVANPPKILNYSAGIDYGQSNATVFLLVGEGADGRLYILSEYYHSGRASQASKSPLTYAKDFISWIKSYFETRGLALSLGGIYYDPSALGFRTQLAELGVKNLRAANNEVLRGIQLVSAMFEGDLIRVCASCKNTIDELRGYAWDSKAAARGEDKPVKENDHAMDALRYAVMGNQTYWKNRLGAVK